MTSKHTVEFVFNQADFDTNPDLLNNIEPNFPNSPGGSQGSRRQVLIWAFHSLSNNVHPIIDSANFGQMTEIVDTVRGGGVSSRIIQWALRINW